ncbi:unnamed protein product [Acanthosepion pharaonis]|uniref:Uncharacterized protein n=1 Tax=Acanthosepion pharaonis TaxID=158019 RepID=A0A812AQP0_ACAPH|nr:unnamed protein product [Sepia pharaonis]
MLFSPPPYRVPAFSLPLPYPPVYRSFSFSLSIPIILGAFSPLIPVVFLCFFSPLPILCVCFSPLPYRSLFFLSHLAIVLSLPPPRRSFSPSSPSFILSHLPIVLSAFLSCCLSILLLPIILPPFSLHLPTLLPPFSLHLPILLPLFSLHLPILLPAFFSPPPYPSPCLFLSTSTSLFTFSLSLLGSLAVLLLLSSLLFLHFQLLFLSSFFSSVLSLSFSLIPSLYRFNYVCLYSDAVSAGPHPVIRECNESLDSLQLHECRKEINK